ncbi:hypothetical protein RN001_015993 [Aquatica leii]|uniref:EF-hand domain-containing protein n=1 Tax=Aquatica leii TaxID=1421715 RepID=A0AAN7NXG3_9COLE|nr:hypothetical protein RN001_015993 [Aquatica leii]
MYSGEESAEAPAYPIQAYPVEGRYGNYAPPSTNNDVQQWFAAVDKDHSGRINAKELQAALINGQGDHFSDTCCQLMIGMFDKEKSGTVDVNQFEQLYIYINQWLTVFRNYDRDQSGSIEEEELIQAFQQMGYRFSPAFINQLIKKSDFQNHKRMSVDQFIVVCVQVQRFTEAFRIRDKQMQGSITIGFEEFLSVALEGSV